MGGGKLQKMSRNIFSLSKLRQFQPGKIHTNHVFPQQPCWNCGLTGSAENLNVLQNGKRLLANQRAKVGRFKLADFFVPLVGFRSAK
jgi:hypothetical protein